VIAEHLVGWKKKISEKNKKALRGKQNATPKDRKRATTE